MKQSAKGRCPLKAPAGRFEVVERTYGAWLHGRSFDMPHDALGHANSKNLTAARETKHFAIDHRGDFVPAMAAA